MNIILFFLVIFAAGFSVFYSFRARGYRKQGKYDYMRFYNAKGNISMGTMLISMGLIQLIAFGPDTTGWRIGVGLVFLLLGLFNFIMGIKNYRQFSSKVTSE